MSDPAGRTFKPWEPGDFDPSPGVDQAGRPSYPAIMIPPNANRGEVEWQACAYPPSTESQYGPTAAEAYAKLENRLAETRAKRDGWTVTKDGDVYAVDDGRGRRSTGPTVAQALKWAKEQKPVGAMNAHDDSGEPAEREGDPDKSAEDPTYSDADAMAFFRRNQAERKEREAAYVNRWPVDLDRTIEDLEEEERREGFLDGERLDEPAEREGGA